MTRDEVIALIQTIIVIYPASKVKADELTVSVWHEMLSDLPGDVVSAATKRMCSKLKFPPSIADIRENVAEAVKEAKGIPSAGDAWAKVRKALSWYGYYRPEEARKALGEQIWRAVEMVGGWRELCEGETAILSAQFERRYNAMVQQDMNRVQIPASVNEEMKKLVGDLTETLKLEAGELI
jgi:hypothetical protein